MLKNRKRWLKATAVTLGLDEPSYNENGANRFKFENVIKSMVARLELQNGLAPVQEYGRHFA
jgi:hypothetical protein